MGQIATDFIINYQLKTIRAADDFTSGTVSVALNSAEISGSDTNFTSDLVGRRFRVGSDEFDYVVKDVVNANSATLESVYTGSTVASGSYLIHPGMHSANAVYSFLQDTFDENIQMDDDVPMSAQTPTEYTSLNGWFIDDRTTQFISGGSIQTDGLSGSVIQLQLDNNAGDAYTYASASSIGRIVRGVTSGDEGVLLDFNNDRRIWWVRTSGSTETLFQSTENLTIQDTGPGSGGFTEGNRVTGENIFANLFSIGSVSGSTQAYVMQSGSTYTTIGVSGVIDPWWPIEGTNKMDIILKVQEMGTQIDGANVTVFTREFGASFDHFTLNAPGSRNPVVLNTSSDAFNTTAKATINDLLGIKAGFDNVSRDLNNGNGPQPYNVSIDCGGNSLANVYEWWKARTEYLQTGSINVSGSGVTEGQTYVDATELYPHNSTYTAVKAMPFGTYTGTFFAARGVWLENLAAADVKAFSLIDANGVIQDPPNNVSVTVTAVTSSDRVFVGRLKGAGGEVEKDVFSFVETTASNDVLTTLSTIPTDTPKVGFLRIQSGSLEVRYGFSNWRSDDDTFELTGTTQVAHGSGTLGYVPIIDDTVPLNSQSISNTLVQSTNIPVIIRVRQVGILPFEIEGTVGSDGLSVAAIRTTDTIITI